MLRGGDSVQEIEVADVQASMQHLETLVRAAGAVAIVTDIGDGARE